MAPYNALAVPAAFPLVGTNNVQANAIFRRGDDQPADLANFLQTVSLKVRVRPQEIPKCLSKRDELSDDDSDADDEADSGSDNDSDDGNDSDSDDELTTCRRDSFKRFISKRTKACRHVSAYNKAKCACKAFSTAARQIRTGALKPCIKNRCGSDADAALKWTEKVIAKYDAGCQEELGKLRVKLAKRDDTDNDFTDGNDSAHDDGNQTDTDNDGHNTDDGNFTDNDGHDTDAGNHTDNDGHNTDDAGEHTDNDGHDTDAFTDNDGVDTTDDEGPNRVVPAAVLPTTTSVANAGPTAQSVRDTDGDGIPDTDDSDDDNDGIRDTDDSDDDNDGIPDVDDTDYDTDDDRRPTGSSESRPNPTRTGVAPTGADDDVTDDERGRGPSNVVFDGAGNSFGVKRMAVWGMPVLSMILGAMVV